MSITEKIASLEDLPPEIMVSIFEMLPSLCLSLVCRFVCKTWNRIIYNQPLYPFTKQQKSKKQLWREYISTSKVRIEFVELLAERSTLDFLESLKKSYTYLF
jgi:hypothetical protein